MTNCTGRELSGVRCRRSDMHLFYVYEEWTQYDFSSISSRKLWATANRLQLQTSMPSKCFLAQQTVLRWTLILVLNSFGWTPSVWACTISARITGVSRFKAMKVRHKALQNISNYIIIYSESSRTSNMHASDLFEILSIGEGTRGKHLRTRQKYWTTSH